MTEAKALRELKKGSQEALAWFIQKYGSYVSTIIYNIIGGSMSQADVEEVASDVFLTLWNHADQIKLPSVKGYLSGVARNMAKNKFREVGFTLPLDDDLILINEVTPEDMYVHKEAMEIVRRTVNSMTEPEREILLRFYYYCQTIDEIAWEMNINSSTIKTKLRRSRNMLKRILAQKLT